MKHENIIRLLNLWRSLLNDPKELLLGKSFAAATQAVLTEVEAVSGKLKLGDNVNRTQRTWKLTLLEILEKRFDAELVTINYLQAEHPTDIAALRALLHDPAGFDITQIYGHLSSIKSAPSPALLRQEFHRELRRDPLDEERLTVLLRLLLRRHIAESDPKVLTELPQTVLTRRGTALFLNKNLQAFINDEELYAETLTTLRVFFERSMTEEHLTKLLNKEFKSIFDLFDDGMWWNLSYGLIENLVQPFAIALREQIGLHDDLTPPERLRQDNAASRGLGMSFLEGFAEAFLRQSLAKRGRSAVVAKDTELTALGQRLGDLLVTSAGFSHDRGVRQRRPDTLDNVSAEAVTRAAAKTAAATVAKRVLSAEDESLAVEVARLLADTLAEVAPADTSWASATDVELRDLCEEALARRSLHEQLGKLLAEYTDHLIKRADRSVKDAPEEWMPDAPRFWTEWVESFAGATSIYRSVFNLLPWTAMTDPESGDLLDAVLDAVAQPRDEWLVNFKVYDILPQEERWRMGAVTFYDPAVYDYGEGRWLKKHDSDRDEAVTFAKVAVKADMEADAVRTARRYLDDALNVLSFEFSIKGVEGGGLSPRVHRNSYVINLSTRRTGGGWSKTHAELSASRGAVTSEITALAANYDQLLDLSMHDPDKLTQLQSGFLRSLYWYRKGRWEPDPSERFTFYWIALEHLFVSGIGKNTIQVTDLASSLHITWRDVSGDGIMWRNLTTLGDLSHWREDAVDKIKGDANLRRAVDASADLIEWNSDPRLLLRPEKLDALCALVPNGSEHKLYFTEYRDDLREIEVNRSKISDRLQSLRSDAWLKILLLYRLRNAVFHEALPFRPTMNIYAETLEEVLEDVLKKIAGEASAASPCCRNTEELIDWYQQPWA